MPTRTLDAVLAVLLFGIILPLYLFNLAPSIVPGDSGELATAAATLGIPHPPGYPLWILVHRVAVLALGGEPARAVNVVSAILAALAAVALAGAALRMLRNRMAALAAGLLFALTPAHWSQALIAEVYSMGTLLGFLMLWAWMRAGDRRDGRGVGLAAFASGLAVTAHYTNLLLLPGIVLLVGRRPRSLRRVPEVAARIAGGVLLGLSPFLVLLVRARRAPVLNWGDPSTLERWWAHLSRRQYGGGGLLEGAAAWSLGEAIHQLRFYGSAVLEQFGPAILLAPVGLVFLYRRERRLFWGALVLFLASGPLLPLVQRPGPNPALLEEMTVFCRLSYGVLAVVLAAGILAIVQVVHEARPWIRPAVGSILLLGSLAGVLVREPRVTRRAHDTIAYALGHDILSTLPSGALLLLEGDTHNYSVLYQRAALGRRPDLSVYDVRGLSRERWTAMADGAEGPIFVSSLSIGAKLRDTYLLPRGLLYRVVRSSGLQRVLEETTREDVWDDYLGPRAGWTESRGRLLAALYEFHRGEAALARAELGAERGEAGRGAGTASRDEARRAYGRAAEIGRGLPEIEGLLATRYVMMGLPDAAARAYRRYLQARPLDAGAHFRLASLEEELGRGDEAARHYERVLELDPVSALAVRARTRLEALGR